MKTFEDAFCNSDPVERVLVRHLKLNSRLRVLGLAIGIGALTNILVPYFDGFLFSRPGISSALEDWPSLIIALVTHPTIWLYYCYEQPQIIRRLFDALGEAFRPEGREQEFRQLTEKFARRLEWKGWLPVALGLTLFGYALHVLAVYSHPEPSFYNPNPVVFLGLNGPPSALAGYMAIMIVFRHAITILALFQLFSDQKPRLSAFHPDGVSGLSFIGDFSLKVFPLIAIMALDLTLLVVINLHIGRNPITEPGLTTFVVAYLIIAPTSFFLPLLAPAGAMREARAAALVQLASEERGLEQSGGSLGSEVTADRNAAELHEELRVVYRHIQAGPSVPLKPIPLALSLLGMAIPLIPVLFFLISSLKFS